MSSGKKSKKAARIRDKNRNYVRRPDSLRGVRPDKRLGQNFLIDEDVIAAIIDESSVSGDALHDIWSEADIWYENSVHYVYMKIIDTI